MVTIAPHGLHTVLATDDNKAAIGATVKDVVIGGTDRGACLMSQFQSTAPGGAELVGSLIDKLLCDAQGLACRYLGSLG